MEPEAAALSWVSNATKACKISSASSRRSPVTPNHLHVCDNDAREPEEPLNPTRAPNIYKGTHPVI